MLTMPDSPSSPFICALHPSLPPARISCHDPLDVRRTVSPSFRLSLSPPLNQVLEACAEMRSRIPTDEEVNPSPHPSPPQSPPGPFPFRPFRPARSLPPSYPPANEPNSNHASNLPHSSSPLPSFFIIPPSSPLPEGGREGGDIGREEGE